jgi:RNA polymerase sigma factor (sigma-70 family)
MSQPSPDHQSWFDAMLVGDERALPYLINHYTEYIGGFIYRKVNNVEVAEELTSNTFLKVWNLHASLNSREHLTRRLYKTARWQVRDYFRKRANEPVFDPLREEYADNEPTDADEVEETVLEAIRLRAAKLPAVQKIVYGLHYDERMSNDEIAQRLKISTHTVRNHLAKIKAFLLDLGRIGELFSLIILLVAIEIF